MEERAPRPTSTQPAASPAPERVNWLALLAIGVATVVIANDFSDGFGAAFRLDAGLGLVGFLVVALFVGGNLLSGRRAEVETEAA